MEVEPGVVGVWLGVATVDATVLGAAGTIIGGVEAGAALAAVAAGLALFLLADALVTGPAGGDPSAEEPLSER